MDYQKPLDEKPEPSQFKPWMWVCLIVSVLLIVFDFDPVGDEIDKLFGEGADRLATILILNGLIIYTFFAEKKK